MNTVCPLGLCRLEEDCPNAPCLDCMKRLGEHMIAEIKIMERQALIASARGDHEMRGQLAGMLDRLGIAVIHRENMSPL